MSPYGRSAPFQGPWQGKGSSGGGLSQGKVQGAVLEVLQSWGCAVLGAWSSSGITRELLRALPSWCSIPGWAGMLGAADSSFSFLPPSLLSLCRQRLLLVLFQCFLLELFEVFWDVCSCQLIDRLGYQMRKQNRLLCRFLVSY